MTVSDEATDVHHDGPCPLHSKPLPPPSRPLPRPDVLHESRDRWGRQILTVGTLRRLLEGLDDDTHVVVASEDWYDNVATVAVPGDPEFAEWSAVTLMPGEPLDTRQF